MYVSPSSLAVNETGTSASFTAVLIAQPDAAVTLSISCDTSVVLCAPTSLTFSTAGWATAQSVVVTGMPCFTVYFRYNWLFISYSEL